MADAQKTEQPKKSRARLWLAAGTLTAVAAGAFFVAAPQLQDNNKPAPVKAEATAQQQNDNIYPAITKDGKTLAMTVEMPVLKLEADADFKSSLEFYKMVGIGHAVAQYDQAEVAANIDNIQKAVSGFITQQIVVSADASGKPVKAQEGAHFGTPKVTKVADESGKTVVWKQKSAWRLGF